MTDEQDKPQGGTGGGQGPTSQQEQPKPQQQTPPPSGTKEDDGKHEERNRERRYRLERNEAIQKLTDATKAMEALAARVEAAEKARTDAEQAAQKVTAEAQRAQMISEIAAAHGLSPTLAKRLHGNTKEELEADAKTLAAEFKASGGQRQGAGLTPAGLIGDQGTPSRAQQLLDINNPPVGKNLFRDAPRDS